MIKHSYGILIFPKDRAPYFISTYIGQKVFNTSEDKLFLEEKIKSYQQQFPGNKYRLAHVIYEDVGEDIGEEL